MYFLCLGQKWSSILPCKYIFLSIVRLTARWGIDLLTLHFFSLPLFAAWTLSCFLSSDGDSSAWWIGGWRKVCLIWVIVPLCRWLALQVASELLCCPFFLWAHELSSLYTKTQPAWKLESLVTSLRHLDLSLGKSCPSVSTSTHSFKVVYIFF